MNSDYGTKSEKEWNEKLDEYLSDLGEVKKRDIIKLSQGINI
jgi:hypothetical protein